MEKPPNPVSVAKVSIKHSEKVWLSTMGSDSIKRLILSVLCSASKEHSQSSSEQLLEDVSFSPPLISILSDALVNSLSFFVEGSISPASFSALSDELTGLSSMEVSISTGISDSSEGSAVSIFPLLHAINMSEQTEAHSDVRDLGTRRMYHSHMRSHNYKCGYQKSWESSRSSLSVIVLCSKFVLDTFLSFLNDKYLRKVFISAFHLRGLIS